MSVLLRHMAARRGALAAGLALALLASAAGLAQPLAVQAVLGVLGTHGSLLTPVLILSVLVVASTVANAATTYLLDRTGEHVVRDVRHQLAARLVRLRVAELDTHSAGDLVARATSDTVLLRSAVTSAPVALVNGAVGVTGALVLMAVLDPRLFAVTAGVLALVGALAGIVLPHIGTATERAQSAIGAVGSALDRVLGAARTVKANGAERREQATVDAASDDAFRAGVASARWEAMLVAVSELGLQASFLVVLAAGGAMVAAESMTVATLVAFLLYLSYLTTPLMELVTAAGALEQGLGAARRLAAVDRMAIEDGLDQPAGPAGDANRRTAPSVEFDDVRYAPPGRPPTLHGVRFTVPAGSRVALVGPSGAGKSTLLSLLLRFDDPGSGTIRLDGTDLTHLTRAEVRARIGYVEQDAPVLGGSLRDNLLLSAPHTGDDALTDAVRATGLHDLVRRLPAGLDTQVGPRGATLSGGERQRLAIARALLRDPGLLLLDEATAHLDTRTEDALHSLLAARHDDRTVLVVAHRLSTVRDADAIVVLDQGRVRAIGTHEDLLASDELYQALATALPMTGAVVP
ncbi:MAG: hypothetical protein QG671_796 [Actinomycetota bacterium]|nr:hypothetical protein [Actinomycetota bacterium]